eukprot:CAMPEP_0196717868 /NCGR_PEP_ID=MMETSP1091-20130531/1181_1 /TAXON_ID=302021 /ORGANISM="Rhodomonas sp., Strain CCMP768" /LENGTH=293 /DNA_ID=CAMNT_0042058373 /DNA_START=8 /DNA_END=889 /DNA_ORIENTATION=+
MANHERKVLIGAMASLLAMAVLGLVFESDSGTVELVGVNSMPIEKGQMLRVTLPASQVANTKVGSILKGTYRTQGLAGGVVAFTGQVQSGTEISPSLGAVTVRVLSDKYITPGTPVSGRVGNSMFAGTVIGSPNTKERLADMEKRLSALEKPAKNQVVDLHDELHDVEGRLNRLEGKKTIKERVGELEDRIDNLEHTPPALDSNIIKDNEEGFHFHGHIGPNTVEPSVDQVESGLTAIEKAPGPAEAIRPVVNRLDEVSERVNELEDSTHPKKTIATLEKRLVALEKQVQDPE